jgi:hypothetical protein
MQCVRYGLSFALAILLSAGTPAVLHAQITSDRPGFADGAATVAPGTVQGELGYAFSEASGAAAHEFGQLLLRTGVTDRLELRGGLGSYIVNEGENGYDGASIGAKVTVLTTSTAALSAVTTTTIPVGTAPGADDRARQTVKLAFDAGLTDRLAVGVNSGASFYYSAGTREERAPEGLFLVALGGSLTSSVDAFVGYAGFYGKEDNRSWVEGGFTVLATPDTQLDVNGGVRVDGNVDSTFFLGLGIAQRL